MPIARIDEFIANIDSMGGAAKSERFFVTVTPPVGIFNNLVDGARTLSYQCDETELPGQELEIREYRYYGYEKKAAIGRRFNEHTLSFICTNAFYEKPFFDSWIEYVNPAIEGYDLNYKSDYVGTVTIQQTDLMDNVIYSVRLVNAFPWSVRAMPLNWRDNSVHRLSVSFFYDRWETTDIAGPTASLFQQPVFNVS